MQSIIIQNGDNREYWDYDEDTDKTKVISHCPDNYPSSEDIEWEDFNEAKRRLEELLQEGWSVVSYNNNCKLGLLAKALKEEGY